MLSQNSFLEKVFRMNSKFVSLPTLSVQVNFRLSAKSVLSRETLGLGAGRLFWRCWWWGV